MTWTEEKVKLLKELDAAGMSAGEIAKAIGAPSRSSVLGKLFRLANPEYDTKKNRESRTKKAEHARPGKPYAPSLPDPLDDETETAEPETPFVPNRSTGIPDAVVNRHPRQCRYPIGDPSDPEFHFCTNAARPGRPYCDDHCEVAYQPISTRDWFEERREWAYANPEHKLAKRILKRLAERAA